MFSMVTGKYIPFIVFLLALVICSFFYTLLTVFRISLEIQAPSRAVQGEEADLTMLIRSKGYLPRFISKSIVEIIDPLAPLSKRGKPKPRKMQMTYRHASETYSEEDAALAETTAFEMDGFILQRGLSRIHRVLKLEQRGVVEIRKLRLYFSDPLGIISLYRTFKLDHTILVRVRPSHGGTLLNLSGTSGRMDTHVKIGETGEMTEFAGTRPYREGDELKHIHWTTVARTGELYVREYTQSSAESVVVLLLRKRMSPHAKEWEFPSGGEFILKQTAAMVIELFNRRIHTHFTSNLRPGRGISIGYSKIALQNFHDDLSAVSWRVNPAPISFLDQFSTAGVEQPVVMIFSVDEPDPEMIREIPYSLRLSPARMVLIVHKSTEAAESDSLHGIRTISCDEDNPENLFANLSV